MLTVSAPRGGWLEPPTPSRGSHCQAVTGNAVPPFPSPGHIPPPALAKRLTHVQIWPPHSIQACSPSFSQPGPDW